MDQRPLRLFPRARRLGALEEEGPHAGADRGRLTPLFGAHIWGTSMRENVLKSLASQATTDPEFLRRARNDLEGTLVQQGYHLTDEELRLVEDLRRRTAAMSDEQLARTLASGLRERTGTPPARPAAPSWRGSGPGRPARPGG
jgi:hypothetical protein